MITLNTLTALGSTTINTILTNTYSEAVTGQNQMHSINSLVAQKRDIGLAHRLTTKPLTLAVFNKNGTPTGTTAVYTSHDIERIFELSAQQFGHTYYPITGELSTAQFAPHTLVLFTRNKQRKQLPTLRFDILEICRCDFMPQNMLNHIVDPTPIFNMKYKTVLKIGNPSRVFVPDQSYIGLTSGTDIYDGAFRGSNPLTMIL